MGSTKIPDLKIGGHQVLLGDDDRFHVTLEEGNALAHESLAQLRRNVEKWHKGQERKKKKKLDVTLLLWTDSEEYITGKERRYGRRERIEYRFVTCTVTSIHAGTGNPIMKIGPGKAQQHSWLSDEFFPPLSPQNRVEWHRLWKAREDAQKAVEEFKGQHGIGNRSDDIKDWLKKTKQIEEE